MDNQHTPDGVADDIAARLDENRAEAAEEGQSAGQPATGKPPKRDRFGRFIPKGKAAAAPREDEPAGGPGDADQGESVVVDPGDDEPPQDEAAAASSDGGRHVEVDDDIGGVIVEAFRNFMEAVFGPSRAPTEREGKAIERATSRAFGGRRIWAPLALAVFLGVYGLRVMVEARRAKSNGIDPSADRGANPVGQNNAGTPPVFRYDL